MTNRMNEEYKIIIDRAYVAMKKWNIFYILVIFPIGISFFLFAAYLIPSFGKSVSQTDYFKVNNITMFESKLGISDNVLIFSFLCFWILYIIVYIMSKRNRIKAYLLNQIVFLGLILLVYYAMFYGCQFFVNFFFLRMLYWMLFLVSIVYTGYSVFAQLAPDIHLILKINPKIFTNVLLIFWGVSAILNLFMKGFNHFLARILLAALPITPILLVLAFTGVVHSQVTLIKTLNVINKNQEKYRQEFGYSVKEWYGKKSKMYKESLKNK